MTSIEWTEATWNPVTGCDRVSDGCTNCYAMTLAKRLKAMGQAKYQRDGDPRTSGPGFGLTTHADALDIPLRWRKPRKVFVNSMSDLFHKDVPDWFIFNVWKVMSEAHQHTFQVLTKRPQRMAEWYRKLADVGEGPPTMFGTDEEKAAVMASGRAVMHEAMVDSWGEPPKGSARPFYDWQAGVRFWPTAPHNVWLGTSVENQRYADLRIRHLQYTPAAIRFLSVEPLLGPVDLLPYLRRLSPEALAASEYEWDTSHRIGWVIIGGESGPGARPMEREWAQDIVDVCRQYGVPVFVKQLGTVLGGRHHQDIETFPAGLQVREYPA